MALRKRSRERQLEAFVVASELPNSPGHPSYTAPNRLLAKNGFDHQLVEKLCTPTTQKRRCDLVFRPVLHAVSSVLNRLQQ